MKKNVALKVSGLAALVSVGAYYLLTKMVGLESSFAVATWLFIATTGVSYYLVISEP